MGILKQYLEAYNDDWKLSVDEFIGSTEKSKIDSYFRSNFGISGEEALDAGDYNASHDLSTDTQRQVITDAKNGNDGAVFYCYYRMFPKMRSGWKTYMGQDAKHYIDKDKAEFYSLAYLALAGDFSKFNQGTRSTKASISDPNYIGLRKNALEYTDLTKIGSMSPFQALASQFEHCLRETIKQTILSANSKGATEIGNKDELMKGIDSKFVSIDKEIENDKSGAATVGEKIKDETVPDFDDEVSSKYSLDDFTSILMGRHGDEVYSDMKGRLPDDPEFSGVSPTNVVKVIIDCMERGDTGASAISKELGKRLGKSGIVQPATWGVWDKATNNPGALGILSMACENYDMKLEDFMTKAAENPEAFKQLIDDCAEPSWVDSPLYFK